VRRVIRATPPGTLVDYRIMWRDPQRKWTSPAGRVLQLGDAAHTFHPSSGNGGTQAVEDAVSIAKCLSIAGKGGVEWATRVSNLLRCAALSFSHSLSHFVYVTAIERISQDSNRHERPWDWLTDMAE